MSDQDRSPSNGNTDAANGGGEKKNGKRRVILVVIALVFVLAGIGWWLLYVFVLSLRETTDDAYVSGNQVTIASQVPGTVIAVLADDTQLVEVGQPLVKLDPTDAQVTLAKAKSALARRPPPCAAPASWSASGWSATAASKALGERWPVVLRPYKPTAKELLLPARNR